MKVPKLTDRGSALPTVIMVMLVVMTFAAIALSLITSDSKTEVFYENNMSALHVAEAGLNMYLWDLNEDSGTSVALDTVISYPEYNPTGAYILTLLEDTENKKVVRATGWMLSDPSVKRSIEGTFAKRTFTQYVYFSDNDPSDIYWSSSDNLYGPYHSNTYLRIAGNPTFWGKATYVLGIGYASGYLNSPRFLKGVQKVSAIGYPSNNSDLMNYAKPDGYYEGRTCIRLNADGTITVWNPNHTPAYETRAIPANGVIYVNERAGANYNNKFDPDNGNVFISGILNGKLTVAAKKDIFITGYDPTESNHQTAAVTNGIRYKDTSFMLDTATGVVMADEASGEGDMLGLIADRHVSVLTYGWFDNTSWDSSRQNITIHGAIFAINGSFINSYHMNGNPTSSYPRTPGVLTIRGAIIQKERGAVALINNSGVTSGYKKDYAHDPRMMYDQPPYSLEPSESGWEIMDWK